MNYLEGIYVKEEYKQIVYHMQKESKMKWYKKASRIYRVRMAELYCDMGDEKNVCHYYCIRDGLHMVYILNEATSTPRIIEWLEGFEKETIYESDVLLYGKVFKFSEEELIHKLQILCLEEGIEFNVYYESYEEDLFFQSGFVEMRGFQYAVVDIFLEQVEVGKILLDANLSLNQIRKKVHDIVQKYMKWKEYPLYDKNLLMQGQEFSCITTAEVASILFHESIAHLAEEDIYNKLKESNDIKLGDSVSITALAIRDYPRCKEIKTNIVFDDMGVKARAITLIENGKFVGVLSNNDEKTEKFYEVCGVSRGSINNSDLQIRMRNIKVENGKGDLEQFEKNLDYGLYIIEADNSYRVGENIHLHVKKGFLVKQGCRSARVEDVWLMKQNRDFLKKISVIGNNGEWSTMRKCNKNGGTIYISGFAPGIACRMNVEKLCN